MNRRAILGPVLILLGAFLFLQGETRFNTGTLFTYFWPAFFVMPVGIFFHWMYFSVLQRRGVGLLVPGGIVFMAGIVCQISMLFDSWHIMWPGFLLAVAVGLFELYWFGGRNKWLLIPINILAALSLLFFAIFSVGSILGSLSGSNPVIAVILIAAGCLLMITKKKDRYYS